MMGKAVIGGTRITVEHILRLLGAGNTAADIRLNHTQLAEADTRAAQAGVRGRLLGARKHIRWRVAGVTGYLADECVAAEIVRRLRGFVLDVAYAKEICPGSPGPEVLALATQGGHVLITHGLGFGELAIRLGQPAAGVVILSLYALRADKRERYAAECISEVGGPCGWPPRGD